MTVSHFLLINFKAEPYEVTEPIVQEEESLHNVDDANKKDPPSKVQYFLDFIL